MSFKIIDDTAPELGQISTIGGQDGSTVDDRSNRENLALQEMNTILQSTPLTPVNPKKPLHPLTKPNQEDVIEPKDQNEDSVTSNPFSSIVAGATRVMTETVKGVEEYVTDAAGWIEDQRTKAMLTVASKLGIMDTNLVERTIDKIETEHPGKEAYKKAFQFADNTNKVLGAHVFANLSEMHDWATNVEKEIDNPDKVTLDEFAYGVGEFSGYLTSMVSELGWFKYGRAMMTLRAGASFGELAQASAVTGLAGATTETGKEVLDTGDYDTLNVSAHAVTDMLFGLGLSSILKGGAFIGENWHIQDILKPDAAYKQVKALEKEAEKLHGKKFIDGIKDKYLEGSVFNDWESVPNYIKATLIGNLSQQGKSLLNTMARDNTTADLLHRHVNVVDKYIQTELSKHTNLAGENATTSEKVLVTILQDAGLLGSKTVTSGKTPRQVPRGKDYDIIRLVMEGVKTDKQKDALHGAIKVLTNSLRDMRDQLASNLDEASEGYRPAESKHASEFLDTLLKKFVEKQGITDPELLSNDGARRLRFADEFNFIKDIANKVFRATEEIDEDTGGKHLIYHVTPARLYDLVSELPSAIKTHKGNNQGYNEKLGVHLKDAVVDMVDELAKGANYKEVLHTAADIHKSRMELIEKTGLQALVKNPHTLTESDVNFIMRDIFAKGGQKAYDELLASIPKNKQEEVETAIVRSLVYGGNKSADAYARALSDATSSAGTLDAQISEASDLAKKNRRTLESFVPRTLKGRQLHEFVLKNTATIDGLISKILPVNSARITYKSEIGRGISGLFHRVWGNIQSHEEAVKNAPYMLAGLKKAYQIADGNPVITHTPESIGRWLDNSAIDLGRFPHSVTLVNMIRNLERLKAPEEPSTPPVQPKPAPVAPNPSTPPVQPKPAPVQPNTPPVQPSGTLPLPETPQAATEVLGDIAIGGQIGTHRLVTPAYEHLLNNYQKKLLDEIIKSDKASVVGMANKVKNPDDPISAIDATSKLWVSQNKWLLSKQKGSKNLLIKGVDGKPRIIFGENALKFKGDIMNLVKGRTPIKTGVLMEDVVDMTEYNKIATALGHPDMFKNIKLTFASSKDIRSAGISVPFYDRIKIGIKNYTKLSESEIRTSIARSLVHELQHRVQYITKMSSGSNRESGREVAKKLGLQNTRINVARDSRLENINPGRSQNLLINKDYIGYVQNMGEAEARFVQVLFDAVAKPGQTESDALENTFAHFIMVNKGYLHKLWMSNPNYPELTKLITLEGAKQP